MASDVALAVTETTHVAEARRRVTALAQGFDETRSAALALVVTELATNLLKHADGGELLASRVGGGIQVVAIDRSPGIADVQRCLVDGFSTAGSPGTGLGAVRRLSVLFDIHSAMGAGTAVVARVAPAVNGPRGAWDVGAVCVPRPDEDTCGDDWAALEDGDGVTVLVADGLGHGIGAAQASHAAVEAFQQSVGTAPAALFERLHMALRPTRGAAIGVARLEPRRDLVTFCGVGNIAGFVVAPRGTRAVVSLPGIVGHEVRKVVEFSYPWSSDAVLVMHSDGLKSASTLTDRYPGLFSRPAALIAAVLYRDLRRERDDATVVVVRAARPRES